jgi:hypothetical protein
LLIYANIFDILDDEQKLQKVEMGAGKCELKNEKYELLDDMFLMINIIYLAQHRCRQLATKLCGIESR